MIFLTMTVNNSIFEKWYDKNNISQNFPLYFILFLKILFLTTEKL